MNNLRRGFTLYCLFWQETAPFWLRYWNTIEKIIQHWAPAPENDPEAYIGFVSSFSGIPKDRVLEDIWKDVNEYRLVLIGMAKFEQGIRWINPVCIDRLDKALARAEFKKRR